MLRGWAFSKALNFANQVYLLIVSLKVEGEDWGDKSNTKKHHASIAVAAAAAATASWQLGQMATAF